MQRPSVAEVDLSAIRDNVKAIRSRVGPHVKVMPAVKANGYGHGAVEVGRMCLQVGADALCVSCIEEAAELQDAGVDSTVMILGCSVPEAAEEIVRRGIATALCDLGFARALSQAAACYGRDARVHIKVDTGMGRIGVLPDQAIEFAKSAAAMPGLAIEGLFTHFASSDDPDRSFTLAQISMLGKVAAGLRRAGITVPLVHASNSSAILAYPEADLDAVRPGLLIYGLYRSPSVPRTIPLREALTLKTRIVFLKEAQAGTTVSYGRSHTLKRRSKVATLPIGYADGYSRALSNRGEACVRGVRVPVIGRICMDQTMLDVTDVPSVSAGDEVILYGGGYDYLSVNRVAEMLGTIPYEILCAIGERVPRVYIDP